MHSKNISKGISIFIIILFLLGLTGCFKTVQIGTITGRVVDPSGNPVQGVTITLTLSNTSSNSNFTTVTDKNGEFSISDVPMGFVIIKAEKTGFITQMITVKVGEETYNQSIILIPENSGIGGTFIVYAGQDKTVNVGAQVQFTATATNAAGTVLYRWDFQSDGIYDAQGQSVTYTYTTQGTYTVTLQGIDSQGHIAEDTVVVNVVGSTPTNQPPTVWIGTDGNVSSGTIPFTVKFLSYAEDSDGTVVSYLWNFGDGETSTEQFPTHTYTSAGTYNVTLVVTDNQGATGVATLTITVTEAN